VNQLASTLQTVAAQLKRLGVQWSVIGGIAISTRSEPRFTRDIDIAVAVANDAQAEKLTFELIQAGLTILATIEQEATQRLATVRFTTQPMSVIADLLFASSGIENEIVNAATVMEVFTNVRAPVARTGHLIALKVLSRNDETRPQDLVDLRHLLLVADASERDLAREALLLIEARGFHRNKHLLQDLEVLLERYPLS
jgi:Nucleotidyl transferase AbiEii toxin, Type IV TA system